MSRRPRTDWRPVRGEQLVVTPDLSGDPWPADIDVRRLRRGDIGSIGLMPRATTTGGTAVEILAVLEDGTPVVVETSWALRRLALHPLALHPLALHPLALHPLASSPAGEQERTAA